MSEPVVGMEAGERAFYVEEFRGSTIVVSLSSLGPDAVASVRAAAVALADGDSRLVLVVGAEDADRGSLLGALPTEPVVLEGPDGPAGSDPDADWLAGLWLAVTDRREVVVRVAPGSACAVAARLAVALRAFKLVVTDPGGGWGRPPRSFADVVTHADAFTAQLAERQGGAVVAAIHAALAGGVANVNLCRPEDLDKELFTFDGAGTLFTHGGYVELAELRVDDLPAVEHLVGQGTADGTLRPRSRQEIARLAVTGLGARVVGSGHLAGMVSLETQAYADERVGEVACLTTVSQFSGSGAGGLLVDGIAERAAVLGLEAVFAITVSAAAGEFFARRGFVEVDHDRIPAAKWAHYDPARRARAHAYWRPTVSDPDQGTLPL